MKKIGIPFILMISGCSLLHAVPTLEAELSPETLLIHYCSISPETFKGKEAIHLQKTPAKRDGGVALLSDITFADGIIEVDIASEIFAGIVFRAQDGDHYDVVYFRPFNSGTEKHENSVQYVVAGNSSLGWKPLRQQFPGKFEGGADLPVMDWFTVKLVIQGGKVSVHINGEVEPVLVVEQTLSGFKDGAIGIWAWDAYFSNFRYTPIVNQAP